MKSRIWIAVLTVAAGLSAVTGLRAQVNLSPGVARVSLIDGNVSTGRGDSGTWSAATINTPLVTGDKISTGASSRAEAQLDFADILRLSGSTEAHIANLTSSQIQVQVAQGLVDFTVLKGYQAQVEIDTPNVAVHPLEPGVYRIEVDSQAESHITVRDGRAEISTPQGSTDLDAGKTIVVEGATNPQYQISDAAGEDSWDQWNDQRNNVIENAQNYQHDNRYYTGSADLNTYGRWQNVPGYNWCWTPYIDSGWVPYSAGRWVWEPFYGWTWVSYEPWGWAPYHYGRWFLYGSSWMWWPGPVTPYYRPVWAPAYVSFFGFGLGGFRAGFGFGAGRVGWLPVGPGDAFFPWYGRGYRGGFGYNRVNITNITNITNIANIRRITNNRSLPYVPALAGRGRPVYSNYQSAFTNERVRGAIMTTPAARFGSGAVARTSAGAVSVAELRQGSLVSGHVPVVPTRASLSASGRAANRASLPSAGVSNRSFFSVRRPGASPEPFHQQAARVGRVIQTNHATAAGNAVAARNPGGASRGNFNSGARGNQAGRTYTAGPMNARQTANGPARGGASVARQTQTRTAPNNGWRRFGAPAADTGASGRTNARAGQAQRSVGAQRPAAKSSFYDNNSPVFRSGQQSDRPATTAKPAATEQRAARPGWRTFSSPSGNSSNRPSGRGETSHPGKAAAPGARGASRGPQAQAGSQGGWQRFSSQPSPASNGSRSFSQSNGRSFNNHSNQRPALELSRPIVTNRSRGQPNYRGSWGRGYNPAPSRSVSAPRSHSAPRSSNFSRGGGFSRGGSRGGGGYHGGGGGGSHGRR